jgi:TatA/E family protein of Tat protein translocase
VFGSLGFAEILFILVLALLVFGPRRLPEVGRTLGKTLREFRRATSDLKRSVEREMVELEREVEEEPQRGSEADRGPSP